MTPFAKLNRLITQLRHAAGLARPDAWNDVIRTLPAGREQDQQDSRKRTTQITSQRADPNSGTNNQAHQQLREQPTNRTGEHRHRQHRTDDAFDDRRVPRDPSAVQPAWMRIVNINNNLSASQAALALLFQLTLDQAVEIIDALPKTKPTLVNLEIEQRAFLRICGHLKQQNFAQQPAQCLPHLTLLARRLGHLNDPAQRDLAMNLLTQSLRTLPQIEVVEALSIALTDMPPALQQRALDQIEEFLWRTADIAQLHVDILQALTRAVNIESCRQRVGTLIATGLKRLRNEPELCAQIRRNLVLAYCTEEPTLQLQA
jgi:hypothetical protein